jgi:hypothetical protein
VLSGETVFVVTDDFIGGARVENRQGIDAPQDIINLDLRLSVSFLARSVGCHHRLSSLTCM